MSKLFRITIVLWVIAFTMPIISISADTKPSAIKIGDTVILKGGYVSTVIGFDRKGNPQYKVSLSAPQYLDNLTTKIDTQWYYDSKSNKWSAGNNKFTAIVVDNTINVSSNDKSKSASWNSDFNIASQGKLTKPSKATLLAIDPINSRYKNNTLEWKLSNGVIKRMRLIEGIVEEYYVIDKPINDDISIFSNITKSQNFNNDKKVEAWDSEHNQVVITEDSKHNITLNKENATDVRLQYPITIDPTVAFVTSASDAYVYKQSVFYSDIHNSATGTALSAVSSDLIIGQYLSGGTYAAFRSFVYFDTSSIPDSSTITSATLSLYGHNDYSTTDFDIQIQNGMPTYPHDPAVLGDYLITNYIGNGGTFNTSGFSTVGYNVINLNATGLSWIDVTGTTKLALISSKDIANTAPTDSERVLVYSFEQGGGFQPTLTVTYTSGEPVVSTTSVTSTGTTTATAIGNITDIGTAAPTIRGICFSSVNNPPLTSDNVVSDTGTFGTGAFTKNLTGLTPGLTYHVRAFATNTAGTGYGATLDLSFELAVTTLAATSITINSATLQGYLVGTGGSATSNVSFEYGLGLGYGLSTASTVIAIGAFNHSITGLFPNTLYHFRATTDNGTSVVYGDDLTFTSSTTAVSGMIPPVTPVVDPSTAAILTALASDPLYSLASLAYSITNIPIILQYRMAFFILALAGFLVIYMYTRHLSFATIAPLIIWGYGWSKLLIPWWGYVALFLISIGLAVTEGRQSNN